LVVLLLSNTLDKYSQICTWCLLRKNISISLLFLLKSNFYNLEKNLILLLRQFDRCWQINDESVYKLIVNNTINFYSNYFRKKLNEIVLFWCYLPAIVRAGVLQLFTTSWYKQAELELEDAKLDKTARWVLSVTRYYSW
jgi:hypothetical protein